MLTGTVPVSQKLALAGLQPVLRWFQVLVLRKQKHFVETWAVCPVVCSLNSPRPPPPGTTCRLWLQQAGRPLGQHGLLLVHGQELPRLGPGLGGAARLALRQHHLQGNILPLPAAPAPCEAAAWQDPWEVVPHTHLSLRTWMQCLPISCRSLKFTYNSQVGTALLQSFAGLCRAARYLSSACWLPVEQDVVAPISLFQLLL